MELALLRIGAVTLESGLLLVSHGKGNRSRAVTVGNETRHALRRYAAARDSQLEATQAADAPFFPTLPGDFSPYKGLRSWLRRLADRAGVPRVHLHLFRHTSAVETLDVGADLRTVPLDRGLYGYLVSRVARRHPDGGAWTVSRALGEVRHARAVRRGKDCGALVRERRRQRGLPVPIAEKVLPFRLMVADAPTAELAVEGEAAAPSGTRGAEERQASARLRLAKAEWRQ